MLRKETSKIADKEIMKRLWDPSLETLKNINLDNEIKKVLNFFLILIFSNSCFSEYIENLNIERVIDGDTVVLNLNEETYRVRLVEIDAPESNQPFGNESTDYLKNLLKDGMVNIEILGTDRYGRKLGRLDWQGENINRAMVKAGFAWVYEKYVINSYLYDDQNEARYLRKGLWRDKTPIEPWKWRKQKNN